MAYRRLVLYFQQGKFEVFKAAAHEISDEDSRLLTRPLQEANERCAGCTDSFTRIWSKRLLDDDSHTRARARHCLRIILASLFPSSLTAEMKHLLGQESRKARSRGRAVSCVELSLRTYQKEVEQHLQRTTHAVYSGVFAHEDEKQAKVTRRVFGRMATSTASKNVAFVRQLSVVPDMCFGWFAQSPTSRAFGKRTSALTMLVRTKSVQRLTSRSWLDCGATSKT